MYQLVYYSTATRLFSTTQLEALLEKARKRNHEKGVTGILLYHEGVFIQVLEGDKEVVDSLFENISRDPAHHQVTRVYSGTVAQRDFPDWSMGFKAVESDEDKETVEGFSAFIVDEQLHAADLGVVTDKVRHLIDSFKALNR